MKFFRRRTALTGVLILAYIFGGPIVAETAEPVFRTAPTGECGEVVTGQCCGPVTEPVGVTWKPVYQFLRLPGGLYGATDFPGVCDCMVIKNHPVDEEVGVVNGTCVAQEFLNVSEDSLSASCDSGGSIIVEYRVDYPPELKVVNATSESREVYLSESSVKLGRGETVIGRVDRVDDEFTLNLTLKRRSMADNVALKTECG